MRVRLVGKIQTLDYEMPITTATPLSDLPGKRSKGNQEMMANDFLGKGPQNYRIHLYYRRWRDRWWFSVSDDGTGHAVTLNVLGMVRGHKSRDVTVDGGRFRVDAIWPMDGVLPERMRAMDLARLGKVLNPVLTEIVRPLETRGFAWDVLDTR